MKQLYWKVREITTSLRLSSTIQLSKPLNLILVNLFWCDFVTPHTVWALFHFSFHCRLFFLWECMLESTLISITRYTCHSAIAPIIVITCTHPQNNGIPVRLKLTVILAAFWTFGPRWGEMSLFLPTHLTDSFPYYNINIYNLGHLPQSRLVFIFRLRSRYSWFAAFEPYKY